MRYMNQNHRVGGGHIEKTASAYDVLAVSNRPQEKQLHVSTFTPVENLQLQEHIAKSAAQIDGNELTKSASEGVDKEAFLSGGLDLFTRTKGMLSHKLGVPEEVSHELASPVVNKTFKIQELYGGDEHKIMERLVDEMQGQMMNNGVNALQNGIGGTQATMAVVSTKGLEEQVKERLVKEAGLNGFEADRLKKTIVQEARDLTTMVRPHKMDKIAHALVDLIVQSHDPSIVYNIKDSQTGLSQLRMILG